MPTAHLADRGIVRVGGDDARSFLQGLVTADLDRVSPQAPRFGALLTPQGKILFDFILIEAPASDGGGFLLDAARPYVADLAKRLGFYKLRAKVTVEDFSAGLAVIAGWNGAPRPPEAESIVLDDPRLPALGWRALVAPGAAAEAGAVETYHARRIALGVPEGGRDFLFSEAFPHEALMDQLRGVDFDKGCYVGQEIVSRMQHRGTARTRLVPVVYPEGFVAEPGAEVTAGDRVLGKAGTGAAGRGLVMVRLDRLGDAMAAGETIRAGGLPIVPERAEWTRFAFPGEGAAPADLAS